MAEVYKVLGQVNPSATTWTTLYTVPALTSTIVGRIYAVNRDSVEHTISVRVSVSGASDDDKQFIAYGYNIAANGIAEIGKGITLGAGDIIKVYVDDAFISVNIFGVEVST